MKNLLKQLTALFIFAALISPCMAQTFSVGPKLGVHIATWGGPDVDDYFGYYYYENGDPEYRTGLLAGAAFELGFTDLLALQPELLFMQKGFQNTFNFNYPGYDYSIKSSFALNYLELPVSLKFKFGFGSGNGLYLSTGPSFGYLMSAKQIAKFTLNGDKQKRTETIDLDDAGFRRFDLGLTVGTGVFIKAGPGAVFLDGRYVFGFVDLEEEDPDFSVFNRGFSIGVGYLIAISGGDE